MSNLVNHRNLIESNPMSKLISPMMVNETKQEERISTEDVLVSERHETEDDNASFHNSTARGPSDAQGFEESQFEEDEDDEISGTLGDQRGFMLMAQ
jgi:hypothetical protein